MATRRQAREWALQALYLAESGGMTSANAETILKHEAEALGAVSDFAKSLFQGTLEKRTELDGRIQACADNWEVSRMAVVDRNILRLAAQELLGGFDTPVSVVIDEALEIAKKYSSQDSSRFINGVLDKLKDQKKDGR